MSAAPGALPLERLQRWMQSVVVHPGSVEDAVASEAARAELGSDDPGRVIRRSATLEPVERVGIYHGMYLLRMEEALGSDYEALKHFLGDRGFLELVGDYVQSFPSRSYTLNRLGDHMPEFLAGYARLKRRDFCVDLARLELAVSQVFDAAETPRLTDAAIAAVPAEAWERARLRTVEAFRLLSFRYPVNAYLQSVRDENHDHPKPRPKSEWLAVFRRDYGVLRLELTRDAHELLADLAQGARLGDAIAAALKRGRRPPREDDLFRWFRQWVSEGVFRAVETD